MALMERSQTGTLIKRGAAVMLAVAAHAADAQVPAGGRLLVGTPDTVIVRAVTPAMKVRVDSMFVLMRTLDDESPTSPIFAKIKRVLDSLQMRLPLADPGPFPPRQIMFRAQPRGWIGINVGLAPRYSAVTDSGLFERYFRYPSIISVEPNSPAQRAGIVPGDVLLAYNGDDVVSHFVNVTHLFEPQKRIAVTVRRDGETKEYSVTVTKAPERIHERHLSVFGPVGGPPEDERIVTGDLPENGVIVVARPPRPGMSTGFQVFSPTGAFGVSLSNVSAELARALKLSEGVLVNDAPEVAPGFKAGLRSGDVIVRVSGKAVTTVPQVQRAIFARVPERSVELEIVRERKPRTITVTW